MAFAIIRSYILKNNSCIKNILLTHKKLIFKMIFLVLIKISVITFIHTNCIQGTNLFLYHYNHNMRHEFYYHSTGAMVIE